MNRLFNVFVKLLDYTMNMSEIEDQSTEKNSTRIQEENSTEIQEMMNSNEIEDENSIEIQEEVFVEIQDEDSSEEKEDDSVTSKLEDESSEKNFPQKQMDTNEVSKMEDSEMKNLVQIQVDTNEMKKRIAAFMAIKRKEVDEMNVQEFCGRTLCDDQDPAFEQLDSCARVDAVFIPRRGSKSHIKISRVTNAYGPQTQMHSEAKRIKLEPCEMGHLTNDASLQAIDERLQNMESHLKLKSDSNRRSSFYQRIKDLENRILLLESTSPEYIHLPDSDYSSPKKKSNFDKEKIYINCDSDELRRKIQSLKESLKAKTLIKTEPNL